MTGNVAELNDPGNAGSRVNAYPNAYYTANPQGPDPSIRARKLYIPINIWFTLAAKMGFPLVSMQYNELHIEILLRPVNELFVIRDVEAQGDFIIRQTLIIPMNSSIDSFSLLQTYHLTQSATRTNERTGRLIYISLVHMRF